MFWHTNRRATCKPVDQAESALLLLLKPFGLNHDSTSGQKRCSCHVTWRIWSPGLCWRFDCDLRWVRCRSEPCPRKSSSDHPVPSSGTRLKPPLHLHAPVSPLKPGRRCPLAPSYSRSQSHSGSPAHPPAPRLSPSIWAAVVCSGMQEQGRRVWLLSV